MLFYQDLLLLPISNTSEYVWKLILPKRNVVFPLLLRGIGLNKNSPVGNYMFKVNNRNSRTSCEISSKLTIKTPERRH